MSEPAGGPVRTFAVVPAGERPVRIRRTARVLMVDDRDRLLLFADSDPGLPGSSWWITTGGGVEPGESDRAAAIREVAEETGAVVMDADLIGPIAVRHAVHGYTDVIVEQGEVYFGVRVPAFEVSTAGHTAEERLTMTTHRWWTRAELAGTAHIVWPVGILNIWEQLDLHRQNPDVFPLNLGSQQESTVQVPE
ncbi:MAG: NUDIX domain-containing protein [Actinomycetota bacterium]|nr:NUDIX domain-containing protein [Actinomycetota bacterium]